MLVVLAIKDKRYKEQNNVVSSRMRPQTKPPAFVSHILAWPIPSGYEHRG